MLSVLRACLAPLMGLALAMPLPAAPGDGGISPFYDWTGAVPAKPGRMLQTEPLPAAFGLTGAARADRILYSSTRGYGARGPLADSGVVFLPAGAPPPGGWPIIAWAHGTTGVADVCAPSWKARSDHEAEYLNGWLKQGYAIVAPDYEGLGTPGPHPYMVSDSAAYSVLDAIRAARAAYPQLGGRVVVAGHSQGAHAALVTGSMAARYAPELDIRGIVAVGIPGEKGFEAPADALPSSAIPHLAPIDPDTPRAGVRGLRMDRFDGWAIVYLHYFASYQAVDPAFDPAVWLTPRGMAIFHDLTSGCRGPALQAFFVEKPPLAAIFSRNPSDYEAAHVAPRRYPDPHFPMPIFLAIGLADSYTAPEQAFNVARAACLRGSNVSVRFYPGLGHVESLVPSLEQARRFVADAMAGSPPKGDCATLAWPGRS